MNTLSEPGLKDLRIFRIGIFLFFLATAAFAQEMPAVTEPASTGSATMPDSVVAPASASSAITPAPAPVVEPVETAEVVQAKKLVVYVSGASEGVNKSLASKLVMSMSQSGEYSEIGDIEAFYKEIEKSRDINIAKVSQIAKKHKADEIVFISLMEAFGEYSVQVRLINTADGQVLKSHSLDHAMKSLEDMNTLSLKIAAQLVPSLAVPVTEPASASSATMPDSVAEPVEATATTAPSQLTVVDEKCDTKYNKNELFYNVREGFLLGFKNCATELVKETVLAKSPFAKKPAPEPGSFIMQCVMGSIKEKVDGVPGGEKITNVVENFLQTLLKAALSGGDPKALVSAASNLDITGMMETISSFANGSSCFVDEPFTPPASGGDGGSSDGEDEGGFFSLGFRLGMNASHLYAENSYSSGTYGSIPAFQIGMVFDFALSDVFHLQPGIMYKQRGAYDERTYEQYIHYLEFPLLISLKFSAFRVNAGPYIAAGLESDIYAFDGADFGISTGLGFDIGWFYVGMFYDYGLTEHRNFSTGYYNRTIGLNIGVNL